MQKSSSRIASLEFGREIARLTEDFTGRGWLFDDIDSWLRNPGPRILLVTGEPGVGKSAVAARLVQSRDDVVAHHFCVAGRASTVTPKTVLRSLAAQLSGSLPGYGLALANSINPSRLSIQVRIDAETMTGGEIAGVVINHLHTSDPEEEFETLLRAPLSNMPPLDRPAVLVIDSLDEAVTYQGQENLVTLLAKMDDFPQWVRVLGTTRPERRVLRYFDGLTPLVLTAESARNTDDIQEYVAARLARPAMQSALAAAGRETTAVGDYLTQLSEGNFLFIKVLLDDVEGGRQSLVDLTALPHGLEGIYHSFLKRFSAASWEERFQPMFGVLAVAQEPITEEQLARFTSAPRSQLRQSLGVALQFLNVNDQSEAPTTYMLYHRTLREFLLDEQRNTDFWCAPEDAHRAIADQYLAAHADDWSRCDDYGLRHLPIHLVGARNITTLRDRLFDFDWLRAKLVATGVAAVILDFDLMPADRELRLVRDAIRLSRHILAAEPKQLGAQMLGRLLSLREPRIRALRDQVERLNVPPWLCPLVSGLERPGGALLHTIAARSGIKSLQTMAEGHRAFVAWSDGTMVVWDLDGATAELTIKLNSRVSHVAATRDGQAAISAAVNYATEGTPAGTLTIWDLSSPERPRVRRSHAAAVTDLVATPDGRYAICASGHDSLDVWDVASGEPLYTLAVPRGISAIATTPDGRACLFSSYDGTLNVWEFAAGTAPSHIDAPTGVSCLAALADGRGAVFGLHDGTLGVWDFGTNRIRRNASGHRGAVTGLAVSAGHPYVVSSSLDSTVKLWDPQSLSDVKTLSGHSGWVEAVAMTPDGILAVSASEDGALKVWDLQRDEDADVLHHLGSITSVAMTVDGRQAISASQDSVVKVWDLTRGIVSRTFTGHAGAVTAIALTMQDGAIVSASADGSLKIWDLHSGELRSTLAGHQGPVTAVAAPIEGRYLVSASLDDTVKVWNSDREEERSAAAGIYGFSSKEYTTDVRIASLAMTPDERFVVWCSCEVMSAFGKASRKVHVWDLISDRRFVLSDSFGRWTQDNWHAMAFAAGPVPAVVAASELDAVSVWALESGERIVRLDGLDAPTAAAVLPDGRRAVFGLADGTLEIWDLAQPVRLCRVAAHRLAISGIAMMANSRRVVSISHDGGLKVWDAESGTLVADFYDDASLLTCCVAPAEDVVIAGNATGRVHALQVRGAALGAPALAPS